MNAKRIAHTQHVYDCHGDNSFYKHCTTKQRAAYRGKTSYWRLHCIVLCLIKRFYWHLARVNNMREVRLSLWRILRLRLTGILRRVACWAATDNSYEAAAPPSEHKNVTLSLH